MNTWAVLQYVKFSFFASTAENLRNANLRVPIGPGKGLKRPYVGIRQWIGLAKDFLKSDNNIIIEMYMVWPSGLTSVIRRLNFEV